MSDARPEPMAPATPGPSTSPVHGDAPTEAVTGQSAPREEPPGSLIGREIAGRYRVLERLGAGGMGTVYRAEHLALAKIVAIKVISPRFGDDPAIAQRFVQEARAASAIGHEHIVQILDFGEMEGGGSFLVMEHLDGEDLAATLSREGPLPWPRVIHIGEAIAWALAAAHEHGIIHRDIKPANCLRIARSSDPDFIKVLDFGLAKVVDAAAAAGGDSLTHTGMLLGTPGYIAPELYRGRPADHRVDVFAVGALMHKLLTGELPIGGAEEPLLRRSGAPAAVVAEIERALADDPERRPESARALALALRAIPRVTGDAATILADASAPRGPVAADPSSSRPTLEARDPTPAFSSLVTVERDGDRLRFSLGLPALVLLVVLILGLVWILSNGAGSPEPSDMSEKTVAAEGPPTKAEPAKRGRRSRAGADGAATDDDDADTDTDTLAGEGSGEGDEAAATGGAIGEGAGTSGGDDEITSGDAAAPAEDDAEPVTEGDDPAGDARPVGTTSGLRRYLRDGCGRVGTLSIELLVTWRSDDDGRTVPRTVKVEPLDGKAMSPSLHTCLVGRARTNPFAWAAGAPARVKIVFGDG